MALTGAGKTRESFQYQLAIIGYAVLLNIMVLECMHVCLGFHIQGKHVKEPSLRLSVFRHGASFAPMSQLCASLGVLSAECAGGL